MALAGSVRTGLWPVREWRAPGAPGQRARHVLLGLLAPALPCQVAPHVSSLAGQSSIGPRPRGGVFAGQRVGLAVFFWEVRGPHGKHRPSDSLTELTSPSAAPRTVGLLSEGGLQAPFWATPSRDTIAVRSPLSVISGHRPM